jgi:hypothetical protein
MHSVLPDGTPSYAPIGTVVRDGDRVLCHLCAPAQRTPRRHRHQEPARESDDRTPRTRPTIRAGCELGRELARSGSLTKAAAAAAEYLALDHPHKITVTEGRHLCGWSGFCRPTQAGQPGFAGGQATSSGTTSPGASQR